MCPTILTYTLSLSVYCQTVTRTCAKSTRTHTQHPCTHMLCVLHRRVPFDEPIIISKQPSFSPTIRCDIPSAASKHSFLYHAHPQNTTPNHMRLGRRGAAHCLVSERRVRAPIAVCIETSVRAAGNKSTWHCTCVRKVCFQHNTRCFFCTCVLVLVVRVCECAIVSHAVVPF